MKRHNAYNKIGSLIKELLYSIVFVAIFTSFALPLFLKSLETSKNAEAYRIVRIIRDSVKRCAQFQNSSFKNCTLGKLDIEDPSKNNSSHFAYKTEILSDEKTDKTIGFIITATRNKHNKGDGTSKLSFIEKNNEIEIKTTGIFGKSEDVKFYDDFLY